MKSFFGGFKAMIPITIGVLPFGAVMGTVSAAAGLDLIHTVAMNIFVYAGAAQLAAVDLMTKNAASFVVVATGLIINVRFVLYSAALSPVVQDSGFWTKLTSAYFLTDQSYSVMSAHQHKLRTRIEQIKFYFGASVCMALSWHLSVIAGFTFGNFAPSSWALDYAIPLSFITLVMPTLKNRNYIYVAVFSSLVSLLLRPLPYNLGLIVTAFLAIGFGAQLSKRKKVVHEKAV